MRKRKLRLVLLIAAMIGIGAYRSRVQWGKLLMFYVAPKVAARMWPVPQIRERVVPGQFNDIVEWIHVLRYQWARAYCVGKDVADIASGSGYGTRILADVAKSVDGYDIEKLGQQYVIDLDKERWTKAYDVIVSFETIEHLSSPEFFLENCRKTTKLLVISVPVGPSKKANPFHKQEWSLAEIQALLQKFFSCEYRYNDEIEIRNEPGARFDSVLAMCTPR